MGYSCDWHLIANAVPADCPVCQHPGLFVLVTNKRISGTLGAALLLAAGVASLVIPRAFDRSAHFETIEVRGNARFIEQVTNALALLRLRSPDSYRIVTNCIGVIVRSKHSGMAAYDNPPTFELNDRTAFASVTWCASSIAHDSIHSKLFLDYRKAHPETGTVPDEVWEGEAVEHRCCERQTQVLQEIGAPASEIDWSSQNTNRFWEIDYAKRNW